MRALTSRLQSQRRTTDPAIAAAETTANICNLYDNFIHVINTVASPDTVPNPRGGGQLPNPNECNSTLRAQRTLTSANLP